MKSSTTKNTGGVTSNSHPAVRGPPAALGANPSVNGPPSALGDKQAVNGPPVAGGVTKKAAVTSVQIPAEVEACMDYMTNEVEAMAQRTSESTEQKDTSQSREGGNVDDDNGSGDDADGGRDNDGDEDQMLIVRDEDDRDFDPSDVLSADEINDIEEVYTLLDLDGNGVVTIREFSASMKAVSNYTQFEVDQITSRLDADHDSRVSMEEFIMARAMAKHNVLTETNAKELEDHFALMDLDGSGAITRHELCNLIAGLGVPVREVEVNAIMEQADSDRNGKIGIKEFIRVTKSVLMITTQKVEI
jgi:Ca2+-binding EF-hand superfamily protein